MAEFEYNPSHYVPFRDKAVLERVRRIKKKDIDKHSNPDFVIRVRKAADIEMIFITDMFYRIKSAADQGRNVVLILPNPVSSYRHVAHLINTFRLSCKHLYAFAMDEYADENGQTAPESWPRGFLHAMKKNFFNRIDPDLRPSEEQFIAPNNKNLAHYGNMIEELGGADMCYSGPGWTGHLAFIEPDAPEFQAPLEEWMQMGARIVTLSPFTLAQNSLHGSFGKSGDIALVPPKAATIGPKEVIAAKNRMDINSITIHGTSTAWQRLMTRLVAHGPVTPLLPTSIHQRLRTDFYISEEIAANIEPDWDKEY